MTETAGTWGRERRRAPRYPLTVPVKVVYGDEPVEAQFGFTADVSAQGALLLLPKPIEPGTELRFRVSLPPDLQNIRTDFVDMVVEGTVARTIARDQRTGIGVAIRTRTPVGRA